MTSAQADAQITGFSIKAGNVGYLTYVGTGKGTDFVGKSSKLATSMF
jgi:hypothetical protein